MASLLSKLKQVGNPKKVANQNVFCSYGTPLVAAIVEPFCPSAAPLMRSFGSSIKGILRNDNPSPGSIFIASDGNVGFSSDSYGMGGMGFEINYECPVKEPCEDIKSAKWCKKQKKKGKCKKASVWEKCQSTCEKCDSKLRGNLPQDNFSMKTKATTTTKMRSQGGNCRCYT